MNSKKRRLYQAAIIIISLLIIQGLSRSLLELSAQRNRIKKTAEDLNLLERQEQELHRQINEYQSDEYIEKIAREKMLLGKEGEVVVILPEKKTGNPFDLPSSLNPDQAKNFPNWKKWLLLFGIKL